MKLIFNFFLSLFILGLGCTQRIEPSSQVMTVNGLISADSMGITLEHEHVTTDFTGAEIIKQPQYSVDVALNELLPQFMELKQLGVKTFVECTPEYIGRDVLLLKALSDKSEIHIITNTGYYAAVDKKYLPAHAFSESAEQLATRWRDEWLNGINGTGIRPGFIKLGVGMNSLDSIERKIVKAGALAHLQTGLKVAIHTGGTEAALDEIEIFKEEGVSPDALIIVHSQNTPPNSQVQIARLGAWVSLDGVSDDEESIDKYTSYLSNLKQHSLLGKVLISHDDGWAVVNHGEDSITFERFGNKTTPPYSTIFKKLIPKLKESGYTTDEINQLLYINPGRAFSIFRLTE